MAFDLSKARIIAPSLPPTRLSGRRAPLLLPGPRSRYSLDYPLPPPGTPFRRPGGSSAGRAVGGWSAAKPTPPPGTPYGTRGNPWLAPTRCRQGWASTARRVVGIPNLRRLECSGFSRFSLENRENVFLGGPGPLALGLGSFLSFWAAQRIGSVRSGPATPWALDHSFLSGRPRALGPGPWIILLRSLRTLTRKSGNVGKTAISGF